MFGAYERWCDRTSTQAQHFEKLQEMCDYIDDPECPNAGKHWELEASEIIKSEAAVQCTLTAILNFINPFTLAHKDHLYSITSGVLHRFQRLKTMY